MRTPTAPPSTEKIHPSTINHGPAFFIVSPLLAREAEESTDDDSADNGWSDNPTWTFLG